MPDQIDRANELMEQQRENALANFLQKTTACVSCSPQIIDVFKANPEKQDKIEFEIDRNNHDSYDIYIRIPLTERVIVKEENGNLTATHADEPNLAEVSSLSELTEYEVYCQNELIYRWKQADE